MVGKRKVVKKKSDKPKPDKRKGVKREKHNVPDEIDVQIKYQEYLKHSKTLDENGRPKPLTENQLKQIIRGAVRKKWLSCSSKLAFLESKREPDTDPNTRRIWMWKCNHCGKYFGDKEINVDHISQEKPFTTLEEMFDWASSILNAGGDQDLQILCIPDHEIKTHVDETGLSWEDAIIDKKAIQWLKENKGVQKQRDLLESYGVTNAQKLKGKDIRQAYVEYLKSQEGKS